MSSGPARGPEAWGRGAVAAGPPLSVEALAWRDLAATSIRRASGPVLPRGLGRSYGDSCLNAGGVLLDTTPLSNLIELDASRGLLRCESGVTFDDLLPFLVRRGFFFPVTPGTRHVTVGGAIANDVHGKNHHVAGTFGVHVTRLELLRSDEGRLACSRSENPDLFSATVGGLGLTGLVTWAEFQLKRIESPLVEFEEIRFGSLDDFHELNLDSEREWEYTVAWVDALQTGAGLGRGIYIRGRHAAGPPGSLAAFVPPGSLPAVPFDAPEFVLGPLTMKAFNTAWYRLKGRSAKTRTGPLAPFFFPLDAVPCWNRLYGRRGLFQYQCVVPHVGGREAVREILERIGRSGQGSFLSVLKTFGEIPSPGMLSFSRPGLTLALDFANLGERTLRLFDELDRVVADVGGALYPAKDARMSPEMFDLSFPRRLDFAAHVDPAFSSSFWRRVAGAASAAGHAGEAP